MRCTIPILNINPDECVGDSVGKHNYNALALDTTLCNLSSLFYVNEINVSKAIYDLESLVFNYYGLRYEYTLEYANEFKKAATIVNLLSSFWGNYEFSISLPINTVSLNNQDIYLLTPVLSTLNENNVSRIASTTLKYISEIELNNNYSPLKYPNYTIINVNVLLYNLAPTIKDQNNNVDPLIKIKYSPTQSYNYTNRVINAAYSRDTVYVSTGLILRFYVKDKKWNYMGYILNDKIYSAKPNINVSAIKPSESNVLNSTNKNINNFLNNCKEIEPNTWYSTKKYVYSNSLYSGTSNKLGKITMTFRTSNNETSTFSYKANGYNPSTNTGGTDVYMEFNGDTINVYEQYPLQKTLVYSWVYPYKYKEDVNFKYTFDNNGVSFTLCGSTSIV
jgi:hypothetical protein